MITRGLLRELAEVCIRLSQGGESDSGRRESDNGRMSLLDFQSGLMQAIGGKEFA
eukprot:CAMPEP_0114621696 /NCGR_PEP_ID=MMETSP0168-20121206/9360_1 /TAXON_ID=95228 ORGANISM="Vannella sp., Strain DIVA3 517/6/12" /NCGR_SAMPLE_ID=MMETSP0168 /ASSEMBLY_ACC=CAM_ASM_000044 /LENGTH=54 /DNA_ID=CAMNT_0001832899 /DNA_START=116 /DNA_END=277 /DNA_ORIENTATION=+